MQKRLRILIADANRYYALLMARELHEQFTACVTATFRSADDALSELKRNHYDAAIVDYTMAYASGRNRFAENDGHGKRIPVIVTVPPDAILPECDSAFDDMTTVLIKKGAFQNEIPRLIQAVLENGSFHEVESLPARLLSIKERAETVNIAARTLAHEINNPLMSILGITELLLNDRSYGDHDVRSKIKVIEDSARRIESVVGHLEEVTEPTLKPSAVGDLIDTSIADIQSSVKT